MSASSYSFFLVSFIMIDDLIHRQIWHVAVQLEKPSLMLFIVSNVLSIIVAEFDCQWMPTLSVVQVLSEVLIQACTILLSDEENVG